MHCIYIPGASIDNLRVTLLETKHGVNVQAVIDDREKIEIIKCPNLHVLKQACKNGTEVSFIIRYGNANVMVDSTVDKLYPVIDKDGDKYGFIGKVTRGGEIGSMIDGILNLLLRNGYRYK